MMQLYTSDDDRGLSPVSLFLIYTEAISMILSKGNEFTFLQPFPLRVTVLSFSGSIFF